MQRFKLAALISIAGIATAGLSTAQDERDRPPGERNMDATHCVRVQNIDQIDIVDSDTLVFRMRGEEVYRNDLPYNCPGLRKGDTLMYRTSVGQLCNVDVITVLEDWGFGFAPGASCGLGVFTPINEQIADQLLQANR